MTSPVTAVTRDVTALSRVTYPVSHATYTAPHRTAPVFTVAGVRDEGAKHLIKNAWNSIPNRLVGKRARLRRGMDQC